MNRIVELRADGRRVYGRAVVYGKAERVAGLDEVIQSGAFGALPGSMPLNLQHDSSVVICDAELTDSSESLELRAEVPQGISSLVNRGALSGLSIEFVAKQESRNGNMRLIESAELFGIALVDVPAYSSAKVELRARGSRLRASMRSGNRYGCDCVGCDIQLSSESLESIVKQIQFQSTVGNAN